MHLTIEDEKLAFLLIAQGNQIEARIDADYKSAEDAVTVLVLAICEGLDDKDPGMLLLYDILWSVVHSVNYNFPHLTPEIEIEKMITRGGKHGK